MFDRMNRISINCQQFDHQDAGTLLLQRPLSTTTYNHILAALMIRRSREAASVSLVGKEGEAQVSAEAPIDSLTTAQSLGRLQDSDSTTAV